MYRRWSPVNSLDTQPLHELKLHLPQKPPVFLSVHGVKSGTGRQKLVKSTPASAFLRSSSFQLSERDPRESGRESEGEVPRPGANVSRSRAETIEGNFRLFCIAEVISYIYSDWYMSAAVRIYVVGKTILQGVGYFFWSREDEQRSTLNH